jgi:hypothetical protein
VCVCCETSFLLVDENIKMGIGKKTRIQAKIHRREVKREQYKTDLIKIICIIFVVGLTASLIVVKAVTLIYPVISMYIKDLIKSYRTASVNPYLKNHLKYEDFKSVYLQKEPILFPSLQSDAHTQAIWSHFETICNQNNLEHPITCHKLDDEKVCQYQNGPIVFNFSSSDVMKNLLATPHLITSKNDTKVIANFRSSISLELLIPSSDIDGNTDKNNLYPTFQQHTQSWNELIVGRKKWYLYRPGKAQYNISIDFSSFWSTCMPYAVCHHFVLTPVHTHTHTQAPSPAPGSTRKSPSPTGCSTSTPP